MMRLPDSTLPWPINKEGLYLLCQRESCQLTAYLDYPSKTPTIGWGETKGVTLGMTWTTEQADNDLFNELIDYSMSVREMCKGQTTSNQFAALVVCAWNIGLGAMSESSMMRLHNAGNHVTAAQSFSLWNKSHTPDGKLVTLEGLTLRRMSEAALYLTPDSGAPTVPVTQAVIPERSLIQSPTMQANTAAVAVGGFTLASTFMADLQPALDHAKGLAADLGVSPIQMAAGVILAVGLLTLYRRWNQRRNGMA